MAPPNTTASFQVAFATAGFSFDPNLSPSNQAFSNAVLAACARAGLPFGFEAANVILAGPSSGAAALPTYRLLAAADVPAAILPGGFSGFATPTGKAAIAATAGAATTAIRSDASIAVDQAMIPTWSALHTFTGGMVVGAPTGGSKGVNTENVPIANFYLDGTVFQGLSPTWTGTHNFTVNSTTVKALVVGAPANPAGFLDIGGSSPKQRIQDSGAAGAILELFATNTVVGLNMNFVTSAVPMSLRINSVEAIGIATTGIVTLAQTPNLPGATTGAQTATFTATNKPGSGTTGPDKWLPVSLGGTIHYIPCFL